MSAFTVDDEELSVVRQAVERADRVRQHYDLTWDLVARLLARLDRSERALRRLVESPNGGLTLAERLANIEEKLDTMIADAKPEQSRANP